jgi:hypothetical protein
MAKIPSTREGRERRAAEGLRAEGEGLFEELERLLTISPFLSATILSKKSATSAASRSGWGQKRGREKKERKRKE